jgi:hypothetical protein
VAVLFGTGNAINFTASASLQAVSAASLMFWIRGTAVTALRGYFAYNQSGFDDFRAGILIDAGAGRIGLLGWALDDGGGLEIDDATATIAAGELAHITGVFDFAGSRAILYKNGVQRFNSAANWGATSTPNTTGDAFISRTTLGGANGVMEDVRCYNRVLGQNEVLTIYTGQGKDGIVAGLQNRWMLNEGAPGGSISTGSIVDLGVQRAVPASLTGTAPTYVTGLTAPRARDVSLLQP